MVGNMLFQFSSSSPMLSREQTMKGASWAWARYLKYFLVKLCFHHNSRFSKQTCFRWVCTSHISSDCKRSKSNALIVLDCNSSMLFSSSKEFKQSTYLANLRVSLVQPTSCCSDIPLSSLIFSHRSQHEILNIVSWTWQPDSSTILPTNTRVVWRGRQWERWG